MGQTSCGYSQDGKYCTKSKKPNQRYCDYHMKVISQGGRKNGRRSPKRD